MHAYINQLAEHDVVSCLHFFCVAAAAALLLSIQFMSLFCPIIYIPLTILHLFIRSRAMFTPQRKQKNTSHLAHTKRVGAFVSKATSCYIFCAVQCIHHFYVLAHMWCSAFFLSFFFILLTLFLAIAESISNQSFSPHTPRTFNFSSSSSSSSFDVDHKKAVFTFNIFTPFFMCFKHRISHGVRETFFATSLFKLAKLGWICVYVVYTRYEDCRIKKIHFSNSQNSSDPEMHKK